METIKTLVEQWLQASGATGSLLQIATHAIMVVLAALVAILSDWLCIRIAVPLTVRLTRHTNAIWDDLIFSEKVLRSACHIVPAIVIWWLLPLVFSGFPTCQEVLARLTAIYITVMALRTTQCMINGVARMDSDRRSSAQQYFHTFCAVMRIVIYLMAAIVIVAIIIDKSPMTLIAGLGATSAILMLVFKDTIEGLVAGIRLTSNDMMHIGDWITVPSANANGTVIGMSLTTVKIRNFDNTIVTISPKVLVDEAFCNWKGMEQSDGRRVARRLLFDQHTISIVDKGLAQRLIAKGYATAEVLAQPCINMHLYRKYMEHFVASRKEVNSNMTFMVRQMEPTPYGMPVEFYFFLRDKEWRSYEHQMADIMEWALVIAADFGLKIYQMGIDKTQD